MDRNFFSGILFQLDNQCLHMAPLNVRCQAFIGVKLSLAFFGCRAGHRSAFIFAGNGIKFFFVYLTLFMFGHQVEYQLKPVYLPEAFSLPDGTSQLATSTILDDFFHLSTLRIGLFHGSIDVGLHLLVACWPAKASATSRKLFQTRFRG